jgi:hypothetical protein
VQQQMVALIEATFGTIVPTPVRPPNSAVEAALAALEHGANGASNNMPTLSAAHTMSSSGNGRSSSSTGAETHRGAENLWAAAAHRGIANATQQRCLTLLHTILTTYTVACLNGSTLRRPSGPTRDEAVRVVVSGALLALFDFFLRLKNQFDGASRTDAEIALPKLWNKYEFSTQSLAGETLNEVVVRIRIRIRSDPIRSDPPAAWREGGHPSPSTFLQFESTGGRPS